MIFPYKEFIKKSMGRGGQEKTKTTKMPFHSLPAPQKMLFHSHPAQKMLFHSLPAPKNAPSQPPSREGPGKTGSVLCFSMVINKCNSSSMCCGGFHSRTTLSGSRYQGRTPPNVVPRTPCPKAKARTGRSARHGLPPQHCFRCICKTGSISPFGGLAELILCAHHSRKQCCGEFHSRTTLSSSRFHGRTPPNAVP